MAGPARRSAMVSPSRAGEINRGRVLKTLYANGPLARPELARLTGSTRATIGQIVQPLLDEGLLEEGDPIASGAQGGKPARPIWFSEHGWPVGAVLLLPDGAHAALVTAGGRIVSVASARFRPSRANQRGIVDQLTGILEEVAAQAVSPIRGIGVAVGGMVDTQTGDIVRVHLAPGFDGLPLGPMIEQAMGIPAHVDNQLRAQVLGDQFFGPARGQDTFCSVYVGEGIGAGYLMDGVLHRGARGAGGEVGHATIDRNGDVCRCGLRGCWETLASLRWLRRQAAERGLPGARSIGAARLAQLASRIPAAKELLGEYGVNIAIGIANLQQTLGLGLFVVHGDPAEGGEDFRAAIEAEVRARVLAHPGGEPVIRFAEPDDWAAFRGAAGIVLSRSLQITF